MQELCTEDYKIVVREILQDPHGWNRNIACSCSARFNIINISIFLTSSLDSRQYESKFKTFWSNLTNGF